jgi:hypothetical protein
MPNKTYALIKNKRLYLRQLRLNLSNLSTRQAWSKCAIIGKWFFSKCLLFLDQTKTEINYEYVNYKMNYQDQIQIKNNLGIIIFALSAISTGLVIVGSMIGYLIIGDPLIATGLVMISIPLFLIGSALAYLVNRTSR